MQGKYLSRIRRIFILINLGVLVLYLLVCLVPFINTGNHWIIALAGLGFPLLFAGLVFFIILWAILRSKWIWLSVVVLLSGFQQIMAVFAFHLPEEFTLIHPPETLRVLQWNVSSWDESNKTKKGGESYRLQMLNLIRAQDADVLCFQEFFESTDTNYFKSNISIIRKMGFSHHFFVPSIKYKNDYGEGIVIFSRFPIIDTASYSFNKENSGEHLLYADIKVGKNIFRIFSTHLQSVHFDKSEYLSLSRLKQAKDPGFGESRTIVSKLKRGYQFRYQQGELVKQKIAESPYPSIICGDFNDVPNSSTYFNVRNNLQDAFLKKGFGIGRTFRFISPTLRIDYILADKKFNVTQFKTIHVPYSDHYPVEADLQY